MEKILQSAGYAAHRPLIKNKHCVCAIYIYMEYFKFFRVKLGIQLELGVNIIVDRCFKAI